MSRKWCHVDPWPNVNGHIFAIQLGIHGELTDVLGAQTSAPELEIYTKPGVSRSLAFTDDGFGMGWDVQFHDDATITDPNVVKVKGQVHMSGNDPATSQPWDFQVEVIPASGNHGRAVVYGTNPNYSAMAQAQIN